MKTYYELLEEWLQLKAELDAIKKKEADLRKMLFQGAFPNPVEGTNTATLEDGTIVKGTHKISRNIDEAALPAVLEKIPEGIRDSLVAYKPSLATSAYRKLTAEERKTFDQALIIKPGTPTLEVIRGN